MATVSSYDPALKQLYRQELLEYLVFKMRPLTGMLPKYEKYGGRNMPIPQAYGNTQGRSHTFSEAQGNVTDSKLEDFLITIVENHSLAHLTSQVVASTISNKHAFIPALKHEVDSAMNSLADAVEFEIPRSGTASLGQVSSGSTVSNKTITLSDISDSVNFEVGMTLRGTSTDGGAYDTGEEVLAAIDRSTGTLTATSAAWNTVMTNLATGDYLVVSGDGAEGGTNKGISGFAAWFPDGAASSSSFFGVDRSVDSRLYGVTHDGTSQMIEDALIDGQSKVGQYHGGKPSHFVLNNAQYRKLGKELGSKKDYCQTSASSSLGKAEISYEGYRVQGDYGPIEVVAANKCQSDIAWGLSKEKAMLVSIGPVCRFDDTDGNRILRRSSASGVEARLVSWAQFASKAPGENVRVKLPAA